MKCSIMEKQIVKFRGSLLVIQEKDLKERSRQSKFIIHSILMFQKYIELQEKDGN